MKDGAWMLQEAMARHRARALDAAEALYLDVLARDARDPGARHMLGVLRLQQGRAQEALALVAGVLADAPGSADVRTHHGLILHDLGRHDEALAEGGQNAEAWFRRGNALWQMERAEDAAASFAQTLRLDPGHANALFN